MVNEILLSIQEVQEGGKRLANWYLSHGYVLLDIQSASRSDKHPKDSQSGLSQVYVRRNPVYVVGRPKGVDEAPRMPKREDVKRGEDNDE